MQEIIQLTANIETNYPELYSYLNETPLAEKTEIKSNISNEDVIAYLETLKAQLKHHIETHKNRLCNK